MRKLLIICFSLTAILTSCSNKSGSEKFVGFWANTKSVADGPNFYDLWIIGKVDETNFILLTNNKKTPLLYKKEDDRLVLGNDNSSTDIKHDKKTDHLIILGEEFEKVSRYRKDASSVGGMGKNDQSIFVNKVLKEN